MRKNVRKFENNLTMNSKKYPKEFHKYANKCKLIKQFIGPLKMENGHITNDDSQIATTLNNYISSMFSKDMSSAYETLCDLCALKMTCVLLLLLYEPHCAPNNKYPIINTQIKHYYR